MLKLLAGLTLTTAITSKHYLISALARQCIALVLLAALFAAIALTYGKHRFTLSISGLGSLIHPFLNFICAVLVKKRLSFVPFPHVFRAL